MKNTFFALACLFAATGCVGPSDVDGSAEDSANNEDEIVGGARANISDFPWQVSVQTKSGFHFCGGSILDERTILTAQHCVVGDSPSDVSSPSSMRVAAGRSTLSSMALLGQIRAVEEIIPFPGYVTSEQGKDVAILRLAQPLTFNDNVQPIQIATAADADAGVTKAGVISTVTGWGTTSSGGSSPDRLRKVNVPVVSNVDASRAYGMTITADQLAAGDLANGGIDSCQGDSGGPLVVTKNGGKVLAGVVSWGEGCAEAGKPGLYARVSSFETFINDAMNKAQ
jgi:secreted trypsin-like serine protease